MEIKRKSGRGYEELREIRITRGFLKYALGSCLIEMGDTRVICAVNIEDKVPQWLKDTGSGWITAEYSLLPSSTSERVPRHKSFRKKSGNSENDWSFPPGNN